MVCLDHCQLTIWSPHLSIDRTTPQAYKLKINLLHLESSEKDHKSTEKRRGGELFWTERRFSPRPMGGIPGNAFVPPGDGRQPRSIAD